MLLALLLVLQDVEAALEKIRAGGAPEKLAELTDPRILDAIAERILQAKPCPDPVLLHLCDHGKRPHAEALLALVDGKTVKVAYAAVFAVASMLDEKLLPPLEAKLDGAREVELRALTILADARFPAAAPLLEKRADRLDPADRERSRAHLRAIGACRARGAHDAVVAYYEKSDDEHAVRALGRMWEMRLDAPALGRADEIRRLSALLFVRRLALGAATSELACDAFLRMLAREEFEKFLKDFAAEKFYARREMADAAMAAGCDRAKGARLVEALLASPDPALLARLLIRSPHPFAKEKLGGLLDRTEPADFDDAPSHSRICDLAVWRLALQAEKKSHDIPPEIEKRDALVREWKARLKS